MFQEPYPEQGQTQPGGYSVPPYQPYPPFGVPTMPAMPVPPSRHPRLLEALLDLPRQYLRVITHPSARTFEREAERASWSLLWLQLAGYALLYALLGVLSSLIESAVGRNGPSPSASSALAAVLGSPSVGSSLWDIAIVPLFFFIGVSVQYLVALALHGEGRFVVQGYSSLLYQVPLGLLGSLVALVCAALPAGASISGLVGFALFAYAAVLNGCMLVAVQRLSGGQAACVVIVPYVFLLCGACSLAFVLSVFPY